MAEHEQGCTPCPHEDKIDRAWDAIFIDGHRNGSLMERVANLETRHLSTDEKLEHILKTMRAIPKTVLMWLLLFAAVIGAMEALAPAIRQWLGLPLAGTVQHSLLVPHPLPQDSSNSQAYTDAKR